MPPQVAELRRRREEEEDRREAARGDTVYSPTDNPVLRRGVETLVKHWSNTGQTLVKHWSNTGQTLVQFAASGRGVYRLLTRPLTTLSSGAPWSNRSNPGQNTLKLVKHAELVAR